MVYRWMCYNLGGKGGGGGVEIAYKRQFTGFIIGNNRGHIYKRTSVTRTQVSGFELSGRSIMHYYSDDWV